MACACVETTKDVVAEVGDGRALRGLPGRKPAPPGGPEDRSAAPVGEEEDWLRTAVAKSAPPRVQNKEGKVVGGA